MRSNISHFQLKNPAHLQEALQLLSETSSNTPVWTPFAGGTDLMVLYEAGQLKSKNFLNLLGLPELRGIQVDPDFITLGSLTTFTQIRDHSLLNSEFPNLCKAASETGAISIQNRGTLGGNIANASPAADSPPALLTYGAVVEVISLQGKRWIDYSQFHTGYKKTVMKKGDLISRIRLPRKNLPQFHYYRKVGTRKAQAISKICFAGTAWGSKTLQDIRIGLASIAPTPFRCNLTEACLRGQTITPTLIEKAQSVMAQEIQPIADIRSTAEYRSQVSQNLLKDFLQSLK